MSADPKEVKVTLVKARNMIQPIENWTVGTEKRVGGEPIHYVEGKGWFTMKGERVPDKDAPIQQWCAIGALREAVGGFNGHRQDFEFATPYGDTYHFLNDVLADLRIPYTDEGMSGCFYDDIVELNDGYDGEGEAHDKVIEVFDEAIKRAAEKVKAGSG